MRILLLQPNSSYNMVGFTALVRPEPLALEIIAASVPDHEVRILDMRVDPNLTGAVNSFAPQVVGVTGYTTDVPRMREICREVKALCPDCITVAGGYHATLVPKDFDEEYVDIIVVGEGEETFRDLVDSLEVGGDLAQVKGVIYRREGSQVRNPYRALSHDLDSLPLPKRGLSDEYRQNYHFHFWENPYLVETARGCPFRCTFCSVWKFHHGKCRYRSPELVLEDLKAVKSKVVCFVDDNFLQSFRRVEKLHDLIKDAGIQYQYWIQARSDSIVKRPDIIENWVNIGLETALIGFEKFREEELNSINKRNTIQTNELAMQIMRDNGMGIWGAFIVDPQWTKEDFDALIDYVRGMKITFPQFTILTPLPGTAFFQEHESELITRNYEVFDFLHTVLPTKLPIDEFYANMARLYAKTTMGAAELKQRLRTGHIPHSSLQRVRGLLKDVTDPGAYLRSVRLT